MATQLVCQKEAKTSATSWGRANAPGHCLHKLSKMTPSADRSISEFKWIRSQLTKTRSDRSQANLKPAFQLLRPGLQCTAWAKLETRWQNSRRKKCKILLLPLAKNHQRAWKGVEKSLKAMRHRRRSLKPIFSVGFRFLLLVFLVPIEQPFEPDWTPGANRWIMMNHDGLWWIMMDYDRLWMSQASFLYVSRFCQLILQPCGIMSHSTKGLAFANLSRSHGVWQTTCLAKAVQVVLAAN